MSFDFFHSRFYDGGNDLIQKDKRFDFFNDEEEDSKDAEILNPSPFEQLRDSWPIGDPFFRESEASLDEEFFSSPSSSSSSSSAPKMIDRFQLQPWVAIFIIPQNRLQVEIVHGNAGLVDDGRVEPRDDASMRQRRILFES